MPLASDRSEAGICHAGIFMISSSTWLAASTVAASRLCAHTGARGEDQQGKRCEKSRSGGTAPRVVETGNLFI